MPVLEMVKEAASDVDAKHKAATREQILTSRNQKFLNPVTTSPDTAASLQELDHKLAPLKRAKLREICRANGIEPGPQDTAEVMRGALRAAHVKELQEAK